MLYISLLAFTLTACWPTRVSFIDGSMPEEWETFYVQNLGNNSSNTPLNYPIDLSELIRDGIMNNTRLQLNNNADDAEVYIEGNIMNYTITPVAMQEGDNASKNRLTVSAQFNIVTKPDDEEMKLTSTKFVDYDSNTDLGVVENTLLKEVSDQIVQDLINKLLSNW